MKKLVLLPIFMSLFLFSCEEGCDDTIAPQLSGNVKAQVVVIDQNGNDVENYPVKIDFQKRWCDGDWSLIGSYSGTTFWR